MPVLIISDRESDLSDLLMRSAKCDLLSEREAEKADFAEYSALALLCYKQNHVSFLNGCAYPQLSF